MDSLRAFLMGDLNRGRGLMVFDWDKAAEIIKRFNPECAFAGLRGDWEWTGGCIYSDGKPVMDAYTYLSSIGTMILSGLIRLWGFLGFSCICSKRVLH